MKLRYAKKYLKLNQAINEWKTRDSTCDNISLLKNVVVKCMLKNSQIKISCQKLKATFEIKELSIFISFFQEYPKPLLSINTTWM